MRSPWADLAEALCPAPPPAAGLGYDDPYGEDDGGAEIHVSVSACRDAVEKAVERAYGLGVASCGQSDRPLWMIERDAARAAVATAGSMARAARRLGVARSTLYLMLRRQGPRRSMA